MGKIIVDGAALIAVAEMLADIAKGCDKPCKPTRRVKHCGCEQPRDEFGRFTSRTSAPKFHDTWKGILCDEFGGFESGRVKRPTCTPPLPRWGVCECEPREDDDKIFGINIRVDEPRREDFCTRWEFERAHEKFDRLVDAAEDVDWENKSNTAPLTKVNAIRRRIFDGPPMNLNLCGETHWWE